VRHETALPRFFARWSKHSLQHFFQPGNSHVSDLSRKEPVGWASPNIEERGREEIQMPPGPGFAEVLSGKIPGGTISLGMKGF
jgi:hypothetical protein